MTCRALIQLQGLLLACPFVSACTVQGRPRPGRDVPQPDAVRRPHGAVRQEAAARRAAAGAATARQTEESRYGICRMHVVRSKQKLPSSFLCKMTFLVSTHHL